MIASPWWLTVLAAIAAAVLSAIAVAAVRPLLLKHVMASPNARSSHKVPTPQGAGIAVIAATLAIGGTFIVTATASASPPLMVFGAAMFMAAVGLVDDLKPIPVLPRLLLQALAVSAVLAVSPADLHIVPAVPWWLERGLLLVAGLWFVNLVNFMDGLDWITVAEVVPVTSALVALGWVGEFPQASTFIAAALCGAMIGFAPFNRPVATIFLGDVGSLPIGLLLGWCLLQLAGHHHPVAALLLPLYYLMDATVTLVRRIMRGEPFWVAHRSHFYQRATDNGFSVLRVVSEIFVLNLVLAALAIASFRFQSIAINAALLAVGVAAVAFLMVRFSRAPQA